MMVGCCFAFYVVLISREATRSWEYAQFLDCSSLQHRFTSISYPVQLLDETDRPLVLGARHYRTPRDQILNPRFAITATGELDSAYAFSLSNTVATRTMVGDAP